MAYTALRVWLLWGVITLMISLWFGFNQWVRIGDLVAVSTPQVEAFIVGITAIGWRQLPFVLLGFFYRRAVILAIKKTFSSVAFVLLEPSGRRKLRGAMALPGHYTVTSFYRIRSWHQLQNFLLLRPWFMYFYAATVLTLGTFFGVELMYALFRGTLALPPIVVQYQAQLITFAGAFVGASVAQWILLYLWGMVFRLMPDSVTYAVRKVQWAVLRRLVRMRTLRRSVTAWFFSFRGFCFNLIVSVGALWPF